MSSSCPEYPGTHGSSEGGSLSQGAPPTRLSAPRERVPEPIGCGPLAREANLRLEAAAATGKTFELVVVLRGTLHRLRNHPDEMWRVRLPDGHYRVVSADSIVAVTPVKKPASETPRAFSPR
jgi:hypothetical protein